MLAGNVHFRLMAGLTLAWLILLAPPAAAASSIKPATESAGAGPVVAASEAEIAARIAVLQAEREQRLAALLPARPAEPGASGWDLLDDPRTWIIGLIALSALSLVYLIRRLLQTQNMRQRACQVVRMDDWDEQMSRHVANSQPHAARAGPARAAGLISVPVPVLPPRSTLPQPAERIEHNPDMTEAISVMEETEPCHQAEFWAALGKPQMAIEILEQSHEQNCSPHGRLLLFDLYRQTGARERYEALRQQCKTKFNVHIPDWNETVEDMPCLKDRPDLIQRINRALSGSNVLAYLEGLLFDDRGGTRYGFELGVYRDLLRLFDAACAGQNLNNCEAILS